MSTMLAGKSREQILSEVQQKFHTQTGEVFRLKRNFQSMHEIVQKHKQTIKEDKKTIDELQKNHSLKNQELKSMKEVAGAHKDAKEHAHHLLKLSQDEQVELKNMHDQLLGLFNAKNPEAFERALNEKIAKFESIISQQDADMAAIQTDFKTMEENFQAAVKQGKKRASNAQDVHIAEYKKIKDMYSDLSNLHQGIKADHVSEKDAITKAFEAELSITKKEHAALKDIHDQLLADFNAGDAEQFKRDLNRKIGDFESLINQQEKQIKDLQAKLESSMSLREIMKGDHTAEKNAMTKAFEYELSITKKEHVALKDIHNQLLIDFGAGDVEQFKRDLNKKIGDFEFLINQQEKQIKELQAKLGSSFDLRESIKDGHSAEKDAMKEAFEAELNITKKEHAAIKDIHDQLLADFNAGDVEQFKRDLNRKIGDFESLINQQEKQIKNRQAKLESSMRLRESMKVDHTAEKDTIREAFEAELSITKKEHAVLKNIHDQLLADFNAGDVEQFKRDLNKKIDDFEFLINQQEKQIKELRAKVESSFNLHESIKVDHTAEKDAMTRAFEAELSITKKEHTALKNMHDQLLADFNAGDAEQFKRDLNRKIGDFESLIYKQEKQIRDLQAKIESSNYLRGIMEADYTAEKDTLKKAFEAEHNITKKEHAALKDIHDQLLDDFNAGDAEQFKRDLNRKISDFESLIDEQEKQLKDLQAKLGSSIKLRESIKDDLLAEKEAQKKALEAEHNITKKEHAAIKKIHNQLLADFKAGDAEQFKRDLNNRIADFKSLIDEQKIQIKDLNTKSRNQSEKFNRDLISILNEPDVKNSKQSIHNLNEMMERNITSYNS